MKFEKRIQALEAGIASETVVLQSKGGIPIESLSADLDAPVFTRGQAILGYVGDELDKIAQNYPNKRWWISDHGLNMAKLSAEEILRNQQTPIADGTNPSAPAVLAPEAKPTLAALLAAHSHRDRRLRKICQAVVRNDWYLNELKTLKVATKKHQTTALLKQQFPDLEIWAVLDKGDEQDIAAGDFQPARFSWAWFSGLTAREARTTAP